MTIQLDRRPLVGGSDRGGTEASLFSKLFQKSAVLLQAFPKKALAVLWNFKGLQGFQTPLDASQIFRRRPPPFGRILDAVGPHSAASRRTASRASGGSPDFRMRFGRRRIHRGAAIQIETILNLTDNPNLGRNIRYSPERSLLVPQRPPAGPFG